MIENINNELFEPMKIFGQTVLFTPLRIRNSEIPEGMYKYEIRHDDDCAGEMVELAKSILVNHWGTIITDKEIDLGKDGFLYIDENKDVEYLDEEPQYLICLDNLYENIETNKPKKWKQKCRKSEDMCLKMSLNKLV